MVEKKMEEKKAETNVLTISDLIKKKDLIAKRELKKLKIFVSDIEGEIIVQEPTQSQVLDMMERSVDGNEFILAECIVEPDIRSSELMKAFGVRSTVDLVKKLFKHSTINTLSEKVVALGGYDGSGIKVIEEIKN